MLILFANMSMVEKLQHGNIPINGLSTKLSKFPLLPEVRRFGDFTPQVWIELSGPDSLSIKREIEIVPLHLQRGKRERRDGRNTASVSPPPLGTMISCSSRREGARAQWTRFDGRRFFIQLSPHLTMEISPPLPNDRSQSTILARPPLE